MTTLNLRMKWNKFCHLPDGQKGELFEMQSDFLRAQGIDVFPTGKSWAVYLGGGTKPIESGYSGTPDDGRLTRLGKKHNRPVLPYTRVQLDNL